MATAYAYHGPGDAYYPTSNPATPTLAQGSSFPVPGIAFDATTQETIFFTGVLFGYGSGNITATVYWEADTASSGGVVWEIALAAITPNTDSQDLETKAFATAQQAADTHLGTTGQRLHSVDITISNLDSITALDKYALRLRRVPADGSDTMTGDAIFTDLALAFSDT